MTSAFPTDRVFDPAAVFSPEFDPESEFDRQVRAYVDKGYPDLLGAGEAAFVAGLQPLRSLVAPSTGPAAPDRLPFALVVPGPSAPGFGVAAEESMPRVVVDGRPGFVSADSTELDTYGPIAEVAVPPVPAYVLLDVERGDAYANWSPDEALPAILGRGRSPLTVTEGIALLTVAPEVLEKNRCFMLLASRGPDKRVPALWISGGTGKDGRDRRGAPKLGWCWAGNRHTWLGHASAEARLAAAAVGGALGA